MCHLWACETKQSVCLRVLQKRRRAQGRVCVAFRLHSSCVSICVSVVADGAKEGTKCVFVCVKRSVVSMCHHFECVKQGGEWVSLVCSCLTASLWCVCVCVCLRSWCRVCENGWKVCVSIFFVYVWVCDSGWRMGRQDGAGDDEWGDRQRRIALYPSVTIPLSLSLSSLSPPVGMMQCLLFSLRGGEGRGEDGEM